MPFTSQHRSNGSPAGCVTYDGGTRVVFLRDCINHVRCDADDDGLPGNDEDGDGRMDCNGCVVLALLPADGLGCRSS